MLHKFNRKPTKSHLKRNSVSFSKAEVGNICFNDDVEITLLDQNNNVVSVNTYSGFVFLNSLVAKKLEDNTEFLVFKL